MAVTENDIINNAAAIASLINTGGGTGVQIADIDEATTTTANTKFHISEGGIDKSIKKSNLGFEPQIVELELDGATTIDLSLYKFNVTFILTLTADSTFVFSNMTEGQSGNIVIIDDGLGSYAWTLSYSGNSHGGTIYPPGKGELRKYIFDLEAVGTASAVEPIFDIKSSMLTPIVLHVPGVIPTSGVIFKAINKFTYRYYGSKLEVVKMYANVGTADSDATDHGEVGPFVQGRTFGSVSLSASDDTYVEGTVSGDITYIENGDYIEIFSLSGTWGNGDAEDLVLVLVCREV